MAHSSMEESLLARLDEIDAALLPYRPLIEERQRVEELLAFYRTRTSGDASRPPGSRSPSKVRTLLTRAREILRGEVQHELPFLDLFQRIPEEMLGNGRHVREHFRGMLMRAGEKYGIEYVDAGCVRLVSEPQDGSKLL